MKKSFLTALILLSGSTIVSLAHAECQMFLSDMQISYSPTTRGELLALSGNSLTDNELRAGDDRELTLQVTCDAPQPLSLAFVAPPADGDSYRYGSAGRATLLLHDVTVDGRPAMLNNAGRTQREMAFTPGQKLALWQNEAQVNVTRMEGRVRLSTWISAAGSKVRDSEKLQLNGYFTTE